MKIGFIGLGNVGGKLARSLLRKNFDLTVIDLNNKLTKIFEEFGAKIVNSPKELAKQVFLGGLVIIAGVAMILFTKSNKKKEKVKWK